jgi:hypothetical protein
MQHQIPQKPEDEIKFYGGIDISLIKAMFLRVYMSPGMFIKHFLFG